jgi:RND family efflux transporter MFP subunit
MTQGSSASRPITQATPSRNSFPGVLVPGRTALIKSKYDDQVASVLARVGTRVRRGQLLLRFRDALYRVERAQGDFDRAQELHQQQSVSKEQLEKAQTSLRLAKADLELARIRLEERSVYAPFTGVLVERYVDPGASVEAGDPLLRVTALTPLRVEALLPEDALARLKATSRVQVTIASPETTLWLTVQPTPFVVDPSSGMFPLHLTVDNSRGRLIPGVSCRVQISASK